MRYTVACCFPDYCANTVTVEADTVEAALEKAVAQANADADGWKRCDDAGDTFVDAACVGVGDPWLDPLPVPPAYQRADDALAGALLSAVALLTAERDLLHKSVTTADGRYTDEADREGVEAWDAELDGYRAVLKAHGYLTDDDADAQDA